MSNRLSKLRTILNGKNLDAVLVSSSPAITYLTGYGNFSTIEREAYLLITSDEQFVITDGRYSEAVAEKVKHFELIEITTERSLKDIFKQLAEKLKIKKVGIEEKSITIYEHKLLFQYLNDIYHLSETIDQIRSIKDDDEIGGIEKSCKMGDKTFEFVLKKIKAGVTEKQLAFEIEHFIKQHGADISFPPIVAFGKNSSIPHHQPTNQKLITNNFVLLDLGVKINNYCSDMTRTVVFGKANNEQKKIYQTVLDAQQKAIEYLDKHLGGVAERLLRGGRRNFSEVEGIKASEVDKVARQYIVEQGFPTIPHSLGHGIGLEVHEHPRLSPNSKDILKTGMVFSIEPGIYIPKFGGVRIEDLIVLEPTGPRLLTKSKRELIEV